jgi:hypothetical protein
MSSANLFPGDLRVIALRELLSGLQALEKLDDEGRSVPRTVPAPLLRLKTEEEEAADLRTLIFAIGDDHPNVRRSLAAAPALIQRILDANDIKTARKALHDVREYCAELLGKMLVLTTVNQYAATEEHEQLHLSRSGTLEPTLEAALKRDVARQTFVAHVMQMCDGYRKERKTQYGATDQIAVETAYRMVDEGVRLPSNYQSIRSDHLRPTHTYLSFADPGDGHIEVTSRDEELLHGTICHVEYIDRDNVDQKSIVEPYRLPAVRIAGRVRMHVGSAAPCTAFIGRPVFEANDFRLSLLKTGHIIASVCSAMFAHGIADCKIAMDGMTAGEMVEFMRVVAGNVIRDRARQRLSAAFNVTAPMIVDDFFTKGQSRNVEGPYRQAEFAIRVVRAGYFNKVAWDGASDERPSVPIVGRLKRSELHSLIHEAHEHGLETYISAGITSREMRHAVMLGVGGVGVGTSLHHRTRDSIGEIDADKVREILKASSAAATTPIARAARELALLDWRHAEGSLTRNDEATRSALFQRLGDAWLGCEQSAQYEDMTDIPVSVELVALTAEAMDINNAVAQLDKPGETVGRGSSLKRIELRPSESGAEPSWSTDPALGWARRVLFASRNATYAPGLDGKVDNVVIEKISRLLEIGDAQGLRKLYPR